MRLLVVFRLLLIALFAVTFAAAQSTNGTVSGIVLDPSGKAIPGADIEIVNDATGVRYPGKTNIEGIYAMPNLPPGSYRIQVSKIGFKALIKPDVVLNVQAALAINFTLPVGAVSETLTIEGGSPLVNTGSAAVSTIIDHNFVENLPLNGRSFNTLLQLTPGVVIAPTNSYNSGQFSSAGQRTSANNFLVDGVSANFGVSPGASVGSAGGSTQALSALGGTSSLVSVEALQEFRIETSSFAPEFGRSPGAQVILTTRSGTNDAHGGAYEYFRNDALDANDWFANQEGLPRAPERHNDFGAFLGAPIQRDRTFIFLSYEGARLRQPNTIVRVVPSTYARDTASPGIAPFLLAYPKPDDRASVSNVYVSPFTGNFSNPATLDAGSVRLDHTFGSRWAVFGRYNESPSFTEVRNNSLNEVDTTNVRTRTLTASATATFSPTISNALRGNYSEQTSGIASQLDSFGGAVVPSLNALAPGLATAQSTSLTFGTFDTGFFSEGPEAKNRSTQLNFADDLAVSSGTHQMKFGGDYRGIYLNLGPSPILEYLVSSVANLLATSRADAGIYGFDAVPTKFLFQSLSLYGQDTWKVTNRLTLTYGVRWEFSPAPSARAGTTLAAWQDVTNPAQLSLSPPGSPLWSTTDRNFAPRIGAAYQLTGAGDLIIRAGWGLFYDLGTNAAAYLGSTFPNAASACCPSAVLPLANASPFIPAISLAPPFADGTTGFAPNLKLPHSYQWNVALEKSLAAKQVVTFTYLGQSGRDLLRQEGLQQPNPNFLGAFLLTTNGALSNYQALQVQYRRPLNKRVQALMNYSWSHSLDNASDDTVTATAISNTVLSSSRDYASSSFDVQQSFSGALAFAIPGISAKRWLSFLTQQWSVDGVTVIRSGFPFNLQVLTATIAGAYPRPDRTMGQPVWVPNSTAGGGKSVNPNAFTLPATGLQGTEGRNDIRGFGLAQVDLSLGRNFPLTDRFKLQFRTDAFNIFNHPNFANPVGSFGEGPIPLESASMLNKGLGGLNPLFQEGGPRSLQLSLKLTF